MGKSLPSLFGRHFIIGHLTPASIFILSMYSLFQGTSIEAISVFTKFGKSWDIVAFSLLLSIFSLISNYSYIKFFEGYGPCNPLKLLLGNKQRNYFDQMSSSVSEAKMRVDNNGGILDAPYFLLRSEFVKYFPSDEDEVAPTRFGNIVAAFESYPRDMYGFEPIHGWLRLISLISKDYAEELDGAKAFVDYWLNLVLYTFVFIITFVIIFVPSIVESLLYNCNFVYVFSIISVLSLLILLAYRCMSNAESAAIIWGEYVKSAVDINLGELQKKLRLQDPCDGNVTDIWKSYGYAVNLRDPMLMPKIKRPTAKRKIINKYRFCPWRTR